MTERETPTTTAKTTEQARLLFVDDEINVLRAYCRVLHHYPHWQVDCASSADEALAMLADNTYDVLLSDVRMPGKSGLDLLAALAAEVADQQLPVVIVTGAQDSDLKRRALDLGAVDLLSKPVDAEDLIARIDSVLRLKRCQDELRQKNQLLVEQLLQAQKMELIGVLAAGAFHDLRNVLNIIGSYSQLAQHNPELLDDCARNIDDSISIASEFLTQILGFARRQDDAREPCDLIEVLNRSVVIVQRCVPKHIRIAWQPTELVPPVTANATQIFQVLLNLCSNAAHAIGDNSGEITVNLTSQAPPRRGGSWVRLELADTGSGMSDETLERLFDPFYTTKAGQDGSGLGLTIVKRIVGEHHGLIEVDSKIGLGTRFRLYLPADDD